MAAAVRTKGSYLQALHRRLRSLMGHGRALGAIKHSIICACRHMLSTGGLYRKPAPSHTDEQTIERIRRRAIRRLQQQGYKVILEPLPKAA